MDRQTEAALARAWTRLADDLGAPAGRAADARRLLWRRYRERHRRYHDLAHVADVLAAVERLLAAGEPAADPAAVRLAAWFHDAVYDPRADDNEAASADLAAATLAGWGLAPERVGRVVDLVLATRSHVALDADAAVMVDADLAVLAAPAAAYGRYARAIRAEYGWLSDADYRRGRAAFLAGMLDRPRLFHSRTMGPAERAARRNLSAELRDLGDGDGSGQS